LFLLTFKRIYMSYVIKTETEQMAFATYMIKPMNKCFEDSLYQHLFDNVWGERGNIVEETVWVVCERIGDKECITAVKYQFGYDFSEELAEEVGELIEEQIGFWIDKNNYSEVAFA